MSVQVLDFGTMPNNGKEVKKIVMTNANGFTLSVLTYGATISNIIYNGVDVALGFDDIYGYINCKSYIGATVGRFANRIAHGKFTLNGRNYDVGRNECGGTVHLHGGIQGFNRRIWDYEIMEDGDEPKVKFSLVSPDGDMGYPGKLTLDVIFSVAEMDAYAIHYKATTDADTVINLTNHAYFNLNGYDGGSILDNQIQINSNLITLLDDKLLPTGEYLDVTGTAYDFTSPKEIGRDIEDKSIPMMVYGGGYDCNYILGEDMRLRSAVTAYSPKTGIIMKLITDQLGVQFYTSNTLNEFAGKDGSSLNKFRGFCLEPQHHPDAPNQPNFPSTVLKAGETFESTSIYSFSQK